MSTLNRAETAQLKTVEATLRTVALEGYDRESEDPRQKWLGRELVRATDRVRTILTMKGHYPK